MEQKTLDALVQNYAFKKEAKGGAPSVDYAYPDYAADGLDERFRFSATLREQLHEGAATIEAQLAGTAKYWTTDETMLRAVGEIAPRLELKPQLDGTVNSIYCYAPLLYLIQWNGDDGEQTFKAYVVKPLVDYSMAWFALTPDETGKVVELLETKAREKPYRGLFARLFGKT